MGEPNIRFVKGGTVSEWLRLLDQLKRYTCRGLARNVYHKTIAETFTTAAAQKFGRDKEASEKQVRWEHCTRAPCCINAMPVQSLTQSL